MDAAVIVLLCVVCAGLGGLLAWLVMRFGSAALQSIVPYIVAFVADAVEAFKDGQLTHAEAQALIARGQQILNQLVSIGQAERCDGKAEEVKE
ncbi:MAG TPA: hypothetical protein O0X39_04240 [Methanocorpusculum sp.]|nr:hypothetical protein [Methanocorpusculum sp.]